MDNKLPEKIIKSIFSYSRFNIKFHVKLANDRSESLHCEYDFNNRKYLKLNHMGFLTLDITSDDNVWDPSNSIIITLNNIYNVISGFKKVLNNIYNKGIFSLKKNGDISIYKDLAQEHSYNIQIINSANIIRLEPTIVEDENGIKYEGVNLYINKLENFVQLPIQYFETVCYLLDKLDIVNYTNTLLVYFMTYYGKFTNNSNNINTKKVVNFDKDDSKVDDSVKSNFTKNRGIDKLLFDGLI